MSQLSKGWSAVLSRSRRAIVALLLVGLAAAVSACGTGFSAETGQVYTAGVGSNHRGGDVDVLNALFVDNGDGTATLSAGILNNVGQDDKITGVTVSTATGEDTSTAAKPVTTTLSGPIALVSKTLFTAGTKPEVVIRGADVVDGDFVTVDLTFENAAALSVSVPIVPRTAMYDSVATAAPTTAAPAPTAPATP